MSTEKTKKTYKTKDIQGSFPAKLMNARIVEMGTRKKVELVCVVDRHDEKIEAKYYGDTEGEYATYAVESIIKAGFIGSGWNDLQKPFGSDTFQVLPINVTLQEVTPFEGEKAGSTFIQVKFINSPDENVGPKSFTGNVNGMEGSFAAARQKIQKPAATPPSKPTW